MSYCAVLRLSSSSVGLW